MPTSKQAASGAPEHMAAQADSADVQDGMQSLPELTTQSAKIGRWMLRVCTPPEEQDFQYMLKSKQVTGKVFTCYFVSTDSSHYCLGKYKRRGKEPQASQEFLAAKEKFQDQTMWVVSHVSLTNEKSLYVGSTIKLVLDMNTTSFQPVLQSTVMMPEQPTPSEDLATLLESPKEQRVDLLALVVNVSPERTATTKLGQRTIVDVRVRDLSGIAGASECEFCLFFKPLDDGQYGLGMLRDASSNGIPVAFFNLIVSTADESDKATLKPAWQGFMCRPCRVGEKAMKLMEAADALKGRPPEEVTRVTEIPPFVPREGADYLSPPATLTVCRVLREVQRRSPDELLEPTLFQLNYVRIKEPRPGENHFAAAGTHLFPKADVLDCTGQLELRMREKVALELSMMDNKDEFVADAKSGGVNFPTLCSIRVLVRKEPHGGATEGAPEHFLSSIIVEAAEQDMAIPKAVPNASMASVVELLKILPPGHDRMIVAPLSRVRKAPHAGLIVEDHDGTRHTCQCVLSLVVHIGNSKVDSLPNGHRIASRQCWNVPFETPTKAEIGAPEHADTKLEGELASYCTLSNVQCYTLSSREGKKPVYAMVLVANVYGGTNGITYMVDKAKILSTEGMSMVISMMHKLSQLFLRVSSEKRALPESCWDGECTPLDVKKSRRLGFSPTDPDLA